VAFDVPRYVGVQILGADASATGRDLHVRKFARVYDTPDAALMHAEDVTGLREGE